MHLAVSTTLLNESPSGILGCYDISIFMHFDCVVRFQVALHDVLTAGGGID